ncbi:MAG: MFS transporter [Lachnospiraceae bacterium]|nr:MFS transporter [Lachnospiraceae bacterium]
MKEISKFKIFILSLTDFSDAVFTGIIASYLMYYFLPSDDSGIITLLPRAALSFATVKAIGLVFDFFIDIFISRVLDSRKSGKIGRRAPIMRNSLIALVASTALIFFVPFQESNIWNVFWLGFFLIIYYISFSLFYVSYYALEQEIVPAGQKRTYTYMVSAITYFFGTIVVILIPELKSILVDLNFSVMNSWKIVVLAISLLAGFMAWMPMMIVKEKDYYIAEEYHLSIRQTIKEIFSIEQFRGMFIGFFAINILTFAIDSLDLYYITMVFRLPEEAFSTAQSIYYIIATITIFLAVYVAKRTGIKKQLCIASIFCCLAFSYILLAPFLLRFISGTAMMIIYYGCLIYPYAAFSVFPYVIFADIAEYDRKVNHKHRSGFHSAFQNFSFKFSQGFAFILLPFVIKIGAPHGSNVSRVGLYCSGFICLIVSIFMLYVFSRYQEIDINNNQSELS